MVTEATAGKKRAPTLYFIGGTKLFKGVALLQLALGVLTLTNKDLPDLFAQFLRWNHLDPEKPSFQQHLRLVGPNHATQRTVSGVGDISL